MHSAEYNALSQETQAKHAHAVAISSQRKLLTYETLHDEVLRFLVKENLPLYKVESPHLTRLIMSKFFYINFMHKS